MLDPDVRRFASEGANFAADVGEADVGGVVRAVTGLDDPEVQ